MRPKNRHAAEGAREVLIIPQLVRATELPSRLLHTIFLSLVLIFTCFTNDSIAMDTSGKVGPPLSYKIEEVRISLTQAPGSPSFPIERLILFGNGNATLERNGRSVTFDYSQKDLMNVLNEFYKIRFFELPEDYSTEYSVFLDDNHVAQTTALRLSDAESTSVCFAVGNYKKCVTYSHNGPLELENVVKRVFSDADKFASKKPVTE
jgi:hypothetical protein